MRDSITSERCEQIVEESVRHLLGLIRPDGQYVYAHRLNSPDEALPGYNFLRHCGTTWYLCTAVSELGLKLPAEDFARIGRAVSFVLRRLVEPQWNRGILPRLCLPEQGSVKIGGNGLALLMLHEYSSISTRNALPGIATPDALKLVTAKLENYIISEASDRDFVHKRLYPTGAIDPFRSLFYTGEALFGLARGGRWTPRIIALFRSLIQSGYGLDVHSHWMCYAACEAYERGQLEADLLGAYLTRLVEIIAAQSGYRKRNKSTPIACRSEAFARFLLLQKKAMVRGYAFRPDVVQAVRSALEENLQLQLKWYSKGQFHEGDGDDTVQIDFIQHNAMSFLQWRMLAA